MTQPSISFTDGNQIPQLGFGVWQVPDAEVAVAVGSALATGYRLIDTAQAYGNERGVGQAVAESGLQREEIFVTTKLANPNHGRDTTLRTAQESLERLGLEQIDLFLIHWPRPHVDLYVQTWKAFVELKQQGLVRSIGVSNFQVPHLQRLIDETGEVPVLNQIELHPYLTQQTLRDFHAEHGIATEAWSPLARGGELLQDPVVTQLATKHGRTPAQIVLGWHLALGNVVIPKSVTPARIAENFDVFDVVLQAEDVTAISALNRNERTGPDPDTFG